MKKLTFNWENCFGIKKLRHVFEFDRKNIHLVYAPNGMMKSSFANTMKCMFEKDNKKKPHDRLNAEAFVKFETKVDGCGIKEESVYVVNGDEEIDSSAAFINFLASKSLKARYDEIFRKINEEKNTLITKLRQVSKSTDCEEEILETFSDGDRNTIFSVLDKIHKELPLHARLYEFKYNDVFDKKGNVKKFIQTHKNTLCEYIARYNELLSESEFFRKKEGASFGTYQASQLLQSVEDDTFFAVNHKIVLQNNEEIRTKDALRKKILEEQDKVLSDKDLKKIFETITKAIDKNAELRNFKAVIEEHQDWIPNIMEYDSFKKSVWLGYLSIPDIKTAFDSYIKVFKENKAELESIIAEAGKQKDIWTRIIELYKARFHVPFNVSIENQEDIVLREESAKLKFSYMDENGSDIPTTKENLSIVLSRGEKRAFIILQFIFEMESRKVTNQETLLIMDDIADSFDYQNKYAIIEYIKDLSLHDGFYSIILTHNYDFYRTLSSRLSIRGKNLWLVEKTENHEIKFHQGQYTGNVFAKAFIGHDDNDKIFISMVPFVRNLIEYTEGESSDYLSLTTCLHQKAGTRTISIKTVAGILERFTQGKRIKRNKTDDSFYDLVMNTAESISHESGINPIEIENKIVLSIAIRLLAEQYMHDAIIASGKNEEDLNTDSLKTGVLTQKFKECCPNDSNINTVEEVNMMTPELIHLNSFMYEPLIDMSVNHLIRLYRKCKRLRLESIVADVKVV